MRSFKTLGLLFILGSGILTSVMLTRFEQKRCRQAEGFLALLRHVRLQIDCFGTPIAGILASLDDQFYAVLGTPCAPADLNALLAQTPLLVDREYAQLLWDFAACLGTGYREEELRYCDYYLARLAPLAQKTRDELQKRTRLAMILPLALSAALALLLC